MSEEQPTGETPKNLLQELKARDPGRNIAFTAVEQLKDPEQIGLFFQQYVDSLRQSTQDEPEETARQNLGYIVGYYDRETADRWMGAIEGLSHPVFGRNIPFSDPQSAYEKGRQSGQ